VLQLLSSRGYRYTAKNQPVSIPNIKGKNIILLVIYPSQNPCQNDLVNLILTLSNFCASSAVVEEAVSVPLGSALLPAFLRKYKRGVIPVVHRSPFVGVPPNSIPTTGIAPRAEFRRAATQICGAV